MTEDEKTKLAMAMQVLKTIEDRLEDHRDCLDSTYTEKKLDGWIDISIAMHINGQVTGGIAALKAILSKIAEENDAKPTAEV